MITEAVETSTGPQTGRKPLWVIIGPGRVGFGLFFPLAQHLGFRTTFLFSDNTRSRQRVARLNSLAPDEPLITVTTHQPSRRREQKTYLRGSTEFWLLSEYQPAAVDALDVNVVSTSIGLTNLVYTKAFFCRLAEKFRANSRRSPVLVIVGENGLTNENLAGDQSLYRLLEEEPLVARLDEHFRIPACIIDCVIPKITHQTLHVHRGEGRVIIEQSQYDGDHELKHSDVTFSDNIGHHRIQKFYSVNSLHLALAVIGYSIGAKYIHQVIEKSELANAIRTLTGEIVRAIESHSTTSTSDSLAALAQTTAYVKWSLERLSIGAPEIRDPIERFLQKLRQGSYLRDGRLLGPLLDIGSNKVPSIAPMLVRCSALALYHAYRENRGGASADEPATKASADQERERFISDLIFNRPNAADNYALHDAIIDDFNYLDEIVGHKRDVRLDPSELKYFFARIIRPRSRQVLRTDALDQIATFIFDLDEGIVSTEHLVFEVTAELISAHRREPESLSHDEYATFVGIDEELFFRSYIIPRFHIINRSATELVQERADRFVARLQSQNPERLLKPGLRTVLQLLKERAIPIGLVSNAASRRVFATLKHLQLESFFTDVRASDMPRMKGKPDPTMIMDILNKYSIDSSRAFVVESSAIGIEAARLAGCSFAIITNDYSLPFVSGVGGASFIGNMREFSEFGSSRLSVVSSCIAGEGLAVDENAPFPLSDPASSQGRRIVAITRELAIDQACKNICSFDRGRRIVAICGTPGARKSEWAKQIDHALRVGFESHEALAIRRTRSMTEAA